MFKSDTSILKKPVLHCLLIMAIGLAVYSNTLDAPFVLDDRAAIVENPIIKSLGFMVAPSEARDHKGIFAYELFKRRYVGYFTFALNYYLHKLDITGYHLVNMGIHIANAVIVYWLVTLTFMTPYLRSSALKANSKYMALFAALVFACHPVQTQAVNYIWQRVVLLATMFYCLSLAMYIKCRLSSDRNGSPFSPIPLSYYVGSVLSAVIAMKSKELSFTLPISILLYEMMFFDENLKRRLAYLVPLFLTMLIIPMGLLEISKPLGELIGDVSEATRVGNSISRWDYLFTQFKVMTTYLRLFLVPVHLNLDYDYPIYHTVLTPEVFLSLLLLSSLFALGVCLSLLSRTGNAAYRLIAFAVFWFFIALSVESSVIPLMNVIFEHRVYLPSVWLSIAAVSSVFLLLGKFEARKGLPAGVTVILVVVAVFSFLTYSRNKVWGSATSLWQDCVEKSPNKARPHNSLGIALSNEGKLDEAIVHYRKALEIRPDYALALNNLGTALAEQGKLDEAIARYERALAIRSDDAMTLYNLGRAMFAKENLDGAAYYFEEALKVDPDCPKTHNNLAIILSDRGEHDEAVRHYYEALKLSPESADIHYNLGILLMQQGRYGEGQEQLTKALVAIHSDRSGKVNPEYARIYNELGLVMKRKGKSEEAGMFFSKAIEIDPDFKEARHNFKSIQQPAAASGDL